MFKVQAKHRRGGYYAPPMYVHAENEDEARKRTRLSDFPQEWAIYVTKK